MAIEGVVQHRIDFTDVRRSGLIIGSTFMLLAGTAYLQITVGLPNYRKFAAAGLVEEERMRAEERAWELQEEAEHARAEEKRARELLTSAPAGAPASDRGGSAAPGPAIGVGGCLRA